jgi:hypothetical protein
MSERFTPESEDIARALGKLKSLDFDYRYDIYAELFREGWATDLGYTLLPALWTCLVEEVSDRVDLEVAYLIGSIQRSFLDDPDSPDFESIAAPYAHRDCIHQTINRLRSAERFCNQNLPWDSCQELIADLSGRFSE